MIREKYPPEPALMSLNDEQYYNTLVEYDRSLENLTETIRETEFKNNGPKG